MQPVSLILNFWISDRRRGRGCRFESYRRHVAFLTNWISRKLAKLEIAGSSPLRDTSNLGSRSSLASVIHVMKTCSTCKSEKPLDQFNNKKTAKDGKHSCCKTCSRATGQRHYRKNKGYYLEKNKKLNQTNRERIWAFLKTKACVDCEESDPLILEFDHLRDKKYNVADMIRNASWELILTEIAKCDVVCANCHKRRTYKRMNSWFYRESIK